MAGLYIHIPFCGSRCGYCDFYSTTSPGRVGSYIEALKREMTARSRLSAFNFPLSTIYIGGGTPSQLSPELLRGLLDHAARSWDCSGVREVTVEANPEDLTDDYLARLSSGPSDPSDPSESIAPNRLSIGIQSFDDDLLKMMNRRHNAERARQAVGAAQKKGFDNISIDLIYGIPGMTQGQWERTLAEAVALGVQHISAYHLTIEPGTAFGRQGLKPIPETESERQFETLRRKLAAAGFEHYEISNFALPGLRALHNSSYWSGKPYLGVGPSAHSFDGARRREWVVGDVDKYIAGGDLYEGEALSDTDIRNERVMTALRTAEGIAGSELGTGNRGTVERFLRDGLLVRRGGRVAIPPEKFLLSDYIIGELFVRGD
jgi:oxygen-independent coproporphyrinogen-3 oxidase